MRIDKTVMNPFDKDVRFENSGHKSLESALSIVHTGHFYVVYVAAIETYDIVAGNKNCENLLPYFLT